MKTVYIWCDPDPVGLKAAATLRDRLIKLGLTVFVLTPDTADQDWLDVLIAKGADALKSAMAATSPWQPAANEEETGIIKRLADDITSRESFARDPGGKLYRFAHGVYRPKGEQSVKVEVKRLTQLWGESARWSSRLGLEVCEFIRVDAPEIWDETPEQFEKTINVTNGLLNTETRELSPHTPSFLSPVQIPVAFDPQARATFTESFIERVFPKDSSHLAYEIAAWVIRPDLTIQRSVLLTGEGSNGKSTYLAQLTAFVGKGNTVSISLHKLEADRFAAARLVGKTLNACADLPSEHLEGTSMFKAITGQDSIAAEHKFCDGFDFVPRCRMVFSANHPPRSSDASQAFFRRWLVIPFDRTFGPGDVTPRKVMDAKLSDPTELSGFLNKALDALTRMGADFTETESTRQAAEDFRSTTDPMAVWLDTFTIDDPKSFVPKNVLRSTYNEHASSSGKPSLTSNAFGRALVRLRKDVVDGQRSYAGKSQVWCYLGIGLKRITRGDAGSESQNSRDSREYSSPVSRTKEASNEDEEWGEEDKGQNMKQERENAVNPVNRVNGGGSLPLAGPGQCSKCCGSNFWKQARGKLTIWHCRSCSPPADPALVAEEAGAA